MCGICGVVGLDSRYVLTMNKVQENRGPDGHGIFDDKDCTLGHQRLAIIDLSAAGDQPMFNEDKSIAITFCGEIYNYKELKKELISLGHVFKSNSDTEVIIHLYEEEQEQCVHKLRGIFSFAIWDKGRKKLFCARDRMGVKPFYYAKNRDGFIFASELRAISAANLFEKAINQKALADYLLFGSVQAPSTLIKDIYQLMPGQTLVVMNNKVQIAEYWSMDEGNTDQSINIDRIQEQLRQSVNIEMVSDVPVAVFLSGGLDSSTILGLASKSNNVTALTVGFNEGEFDERELAKKVAKYFGIPHKEVLITGAEFHSMFDEILQKMDQPSADGFNTYIVSQQAKKNGFKVAISGLGGDEIFFGYPNVRRIRSMLLINRICRRIISHSIRNTFFNIFYRSSLSMKLKKMLYVFFKSNSDHEVYQLARMVLSPRDVELLLGAKFATEEKNFSYSSKNANQLMAADISCYARNTLLRDSDQMGMANSVEIREPFFDYKMVETMFAAPDSIKTFGRPKQALFSIFNNLTHNSFAERNKKGFVLPFDHWFRDDLREYCQKKLDHAPDKILNRQQVQSIWSDYQKNKNSYSYTSVLTLIALINWFEINS
jgi:asparagine synthase (glutamine-hydrolysing)